MHWRIGCHGDLGVFNMPVYFWHELGVTYSTFSNSNN